MSAGRLALVGSPRSGGGLAQTLWLADSRWGRSSLSAKEGLDDIEASLAEGPEWTIDWAPKLSLHIAEIAAADPDATFIRVVRDPRRAVASLVQAWRSGRFVSEPDLEGWWGEPWSFPLIPGWAELAGKPLHEVAAAQWFAIDAAVRDALAQLDTSRVATVRFEELIDDPETEFARVCTELGVEWSAELPDDLPLSPFTVTRPDERNCGVWVVDTQAGAIVGLLRFRGAVQEIFDVKVLPGVTWPTVVTDPEVLASSFVLSPNAMGQLATPVN